MATAFPRFTALDADHFRSVRLTERMAALSAELEASKALMEHQFLWVTLLMTTVVYVLARAVDSVWVVPLVLPLVVLGAGGLQHVLILYRYHVRRESLPAICEGIGRLRHRIGDAPDICLDRMVRAGLLPGHGQSLIEDAIFGDHQGHRLSLAMVDLRNGMEDLHPDCGRGDLFHGLVAAIRWPEAPESLPSDELAPLIDGGRHIGFTWFEGYLLLAIPCRRSPFQLSGLFARSDQLIAELRLAASVIRIPHRLIDHLKRDEGPKDGFCMTV